MKCFFNKLFLFVMSISCTVLFSGCIQIVDGERDDNKATVATAIADEIQENQGESASSSIITEYNWHASQDGSLIVFEADGTFKYYRFADDLTDNYYGGTYDFYMGEGAVTYITTTLSDYGVTKDELVNIFNNNDEYDESNFVCLVLNNEICIVEGENQIASPYQTPYFGFCLEDDGTLYLDIANMNTGNYFLYIAE